jgi:hypothetical protein
MKSFCETLSRSVAAEISAGLFLIGLSFSPLNGWGQTAQVKAKSASGGAIAFSQGSGKSAPTDEIAQLLKRIDVAESRLDIMNLLARYSLDVDLERNEDMLKLFTDDCVFGTDISGTVVYTRGKEELRAKFATPAPKSQHLQLDYVFNVDGDTGAAYGYQILTGSRDNAVSVNRIADRAFTFRRVNGVWLIKDAIAINVNNDAEVQKLIPALH